MQILKTIKLIISCLYCLMILAIALSCSRQATKKLININLDKFPTVKIDSVEMDTNNVKGVVRKIICERKEDSLLFVMRCPVNMDITSNKWTIMLLANEIENSGNERLSIKILNKCFNEDAYRLIPPEKRKYNDSEQFILNIDKNEKLYYKGMLVTIDHFIKQISPEITESKNTVVIHADRTVRWKVVVEIIKKCKEKNLRCLAASE